MRGIHAIQNFATNSRLTHELQEVTTDYQLRTDNVSATNPIMCHFVAIRGIRGRSGIVFN